MFEWVDGCIIIIYLCIRMLEIYVDELTFCFLHMKDILPSSRSFLYRTLILLMSPSLDIYN